MPASTTPFQAIQTTHFVTYRRGSLSSILRMNKRDYPTFRENRLIPRQVYRSISGSGHPDRWMIASQSIRSCLSTEVWSVNFHHSVATIPWFRVPTKRCSYPQRKYRHSAERDIPVFAAVCLWNPYCPHNYLFVIHSSRFSLEATHKRFSNR